MHTKRTVIQPGHKLKLDLRAVERQAILDQGLCLPPEYEARFEKTRPDQPRLLMLDDLEDFSGHVAAGVAND